MAKAGFSGIFRVASLIPGKYYLAASGAVILFLCYEIGKTIVTPVKVPLTRESRTAETTLTLHGQEKVPILPTITAGNIFRRQRKEFQPPPPPPPSKTPQGIPEEAVPEIKLLGIIITDTTRLAIIDAELKRYIRREVHPDVVLSGLRQLPLSSDGKFYETIPLKGDKLASQTFHEGDSVAEYTVSKINEDSIEVEAVKNGKHTIIALESADAANALAAQVARTAPSTMTDFALSGARGK